MADPIVPTRDQLSRILGTSDHRIIRQFERLFEQAGDLLPSDVATIYRLVQENYVDAGIADIKAGNALDNIELLKKRLSEIDLESGTNGSKANEALDNIVLLRRYVDEVGIGSGIANTKAMEALDGIERTIKYLEEVNILAGNADAKANQALALITRLTNRVQKVVSITANYSAMVGNYSIQADATGGAITVTLPLASTAESFIIGVTKKDTSTNTVTIARSGTDTIVGETSQVLSYAAEVINVISDGTNWELVN